MSGGFAVWCMLSLAASDGGARPDSPWALSQHRRRKTQLIGMGVLGGWAVANIAGGVTASRFDRNRRYFHEGNAIWNSVNLAIAIAGLAGNARRRPAPPTREAALRIEKRTRRTYFINALVDLAYIAGGTATLALGQHYGSARVRGYGTAVVFQGAFLFAFDVGMMIAHARVVAKSSTP